MKGLKNQVALNTRTRVPFASFVKLARTDNNYINKHANSVLDAKKLFEENRPKLVIELIGIDPLEWKNVNEVATNWHYVDAEEAEFFPLKIPKVMLTITQLLPITKLRL